MRQRSGATWAATEGARVATRACRRDYRLRCCTARLDVIRDGHGARPTGDVERVTGRPARTFERFAADAVAAGAWRAGVRA